MSDFAVTKTRMIEGIWQGVITKASNTDRQPEINVEHLGKQVPGFAITENREAGNWALQIPVPPELIADGTQTFLICDARDGDVLDSFSLICGEALGDDIRAEMNLLREELDMLKRAFRRHCLETM